MNSEKSKKYLSLIIPAYNESSVIETTVRDASTYLNAQGFDHEIIIVNDGSVDETETIIRQLENEVTKVKVITYEKNRGKGHAVKEGVLNSTGSLVLFMDADHSVHISNLERFIVSLENADLAIASIELPEAMAVDQNHPYRRVLGKSAKWLVRLVVPQIKDTQRGFKLFRGDLAREVFSEVSIAGWGFDIEALLLCQEKGSVIAELPVEWQNRPGSRVTLGSYVTTLGDLGRIVRKRLNKKHKS